MSSVYFYGGVGPLQLLSFGFNKGLMVMRYLETIWIQM